MVNFEKIRLYVYSGTLYTKYHAYRNKTNGPYADYWGKSRCVYIWGTISQPEPIWFIRKIDICMATGTSYVKFRKDRNTNVDLWLLSVFRDGYIDDV